MQRVLSAPAAVLTQLQAFPSVGLALCGYVVPPFAHLAGKCDRRSFGASHLCSLVPRSPYYVLRST